MDQFDDVDPLIVVGYEGIWGVVFNVPMLVIFNLIPCSNAQLCNGGVIENSLNALKELSMSPAQSIYTFLLVPLVLLFNTSGTTVTSYGSAAARTTLEQVRNFLVWVFFMFVPVNEKYVDHFTWLQLIGFVVLISGILFFNEIVTLSFCMRKQKDVDVSVDDTALMDKSSPSNGYNGNKKNPNMLSINGKIRDETEVIDLN